MRTTDGTLLRADVRDTVFNLTVLTRRLYTYTCFFPPDFRITRAQLVSNLFAPRNSRIIENAVSRFFCVCALGLDAEFTYLSTIGLQLFRFSFPKIDFKRITGSPILNVGFHEFRRLLLTFPLRKRFHFNKISFSKSIIFVVETKLYVLGFQTTTRPEA